MDAFTTFIESLSSATFDYFRSTPGAEVESREAFEEMRTYLRNLYAGVTVVASFVESDGQVIDCIPIDQHPAAKRWSTCDPSAIEAIEAIASTTQPSPEMYGANPPLFASSDKGTAASALDAPGPGAPFARRDYPPGTLPMPRTTLEQLSRFKNLAAFSAREARADDVGVRTASGLIRRYATGEQDIACLGGGSYVNVWKPFVIPGVQGCFGMQWYSAVRDGVLMQTVECGWHIDAQRYGNAEPHLFVFTTRRNYERGDSFYNQDGGAFLPVPNPYVLPGVTTLRSSLTDGAQVEHKMGFYLTNDAWVFYFDDHPVGAYRLPWFEGGPLAFGAARVTFGGEVGTGMSPGPTQWPPMGSGRHAAAGFGKTAYQRAAFVNPVSGGGVIATLAVAGSTTGSCYTIDITNNSPSAWGTYLFYGGPGGSGC